MSQGGAFYLADVKSLGANNKVNTEERVLHFRLPKTGFDDRADREHIKNYSVDFSNFMLANPDFKNPFGEEPDALYVGNKLLNPGDTTAEPVTKEPVHPDSVKSDREREREQQEPHEGVDVAPAARGSEAPKGEDALEAPEESKKGFRSKK